MTDTIAPPLARIPRERPGSAAETPSGAEEPELSQPTPGQVGAGDARADALMVTDLLLDLGSLAGLLEGRLECSDWLDAFLLCAGISQIVEDAMSGSSAAGGRAWWRRAAAELERYRFGRMPAAAVRTAVELADFLVAISRKGRELEKLARAARSTCDSLADALYHPPQAASARARLLLRSGREVSRQCARSWVLGTGRSQRLPSCFRSFDQHPADVEELVDRFVARHPDRTRPVVVVGVRTSGSYLGPLAVSALRGRGFACESVTLRPRACIGTDVRRTLRRSLARGARLVVIDDPPDTGQTLSDVAHEALRIGYGVDSISLLFALLEGAASPERLRPFDCMTLEWKQWYVHKLMAGDTMKQLLGELVAPSLEVESVTAHPSTAPTGRCHARTEYTVTVVPSAPAPGAARRPELERLRERRTWELVATGSGLGYFGRHSEAIAAALDGAVPPFLGFAQGIFVHHKVPDLVEDDSPPGYRMQQEVVRYVARRRDALRADFDRSRALSGNQPAWEVASILLGRALGRPGLALRPFLVEPVVRSLLSTDVASVIDGNMERGLWKGGQHGDVLKDDAASHFGHFDLSSYDSVFDLAAAELEMRAFDLSAPGALYLRPLFHALTGTDVDGERWLAYQLVHVWDAHRRGRIGEVDRVRASSACVNRYLAGILLDDLPPVDSGPICALDVDGVLETAALGFPACTYSGAMALRALRAHGHRVILASGRPLADIVDLCRIFELAGGVAEYGSVAFVTATGDIHELMAQSASMDIRRLREHCAGDGSFDVDMRWERTVRVRRPSGEGRAGRSSGAGGANGSIPAALSRIPSSAAGPGWTFVDGDDQVDIVHRSVDKGRGISALCALIGTAGAGDDMDGPPVVMAIGDTAADVPLLRVSRRAFVPSHARGQQGVEDTTIMPSAYQRGLYEAVAALIGHTPGSCPQCRARDMSPRERAMVDLISVQEAGPAGYPARLIGLARNVARRRFLQ